MNNRFFGQPKKKQGKAGMFADPPALASTQDGVQSGVQDCTQVSTQDGTRNGTQDGVQESVHMRVQVSEDFEQRLQEATQKELYKARTVRFHKDVLEAIDKLPNGNGHRQLIISEAMKIGLTALGFWKTGEEDKLHDTDD